MKQADESVRTDGARKWEAAESEVRRLLMRATDLCIKDGLFNAETKSKYDLSGKNTVYTRLVQWCSSFIKQSVENVEFILLKKRQHIMKCIYASIKYHTCCVKTAIFIFVILYMMLVESVLTSLAVTLEIRSSGYATPLGSDTKALCVHHLLGDSESPSRIRNVDLISALAL